MIGYTLRRLAQFVPVLLVASIAVWAIIYAAPGSPAEALAGESASPEQVVAMAERMGLNDPIYVQYGRWFVNLVSGDLGNSAISGLPVLDQLVARVPATIWLGLLTVAIGVLVGLPLGAVQALRPRSVAARLIGVYQSIGMALPTFWVGLLLVLVFAVNLQWLPMPAQYIPPWSDPAASFANILLPAITIAVLVAAVLSRFFAAALSEALSADFVRLARSKGASEHSVVIRHGATNAMLPTVTVIGLQIGSLFGGAVVTEVVFNYPGLGRLLFNAVVARDYPLVQGAVMFIVVVFLVLNLIVDLLYARLDPRVRVGQH